MKVSEHINELRKILVRTAITITAVFIVLFAFSKKLILFGIDYFNISAYAFTPFESINVQISLSLGLTLLLLIPYLLLEIYLYLKEEFKIQHFYTTITASYLLALFGFLLGSLVISKLAIESLTKSSIFLVQWSATSTLSLILMMGLLSAGCMQLILIIPLLTKMGLITKQSYYQKRKYYIVGTLLLVAIITPTTDAVSLGLSMLPLVGATELGFAISNSEDKQC
jgi:sec-independent protein translocase protein TatC